MRTDPFYFALALVSSLTFGALPVRSGPNVLFDSGDTLPIAPLALESGFVDQSADAIETPKPLEGGGLFPVVSDALSPGEVKRAPTGSRALALQAPLFLVGDDGGSIEWLTTHLESLRKAGAAGLMVSARTREDYDALRELAASAGLPLALGAGDEVAKLFGIQHYPVLIGPDWIEQ
ncbi:MAG: PFL_4695 family integrating conjugative element protein [Candidatus Sedimenticola endophacoides]